MFDKELILKALNGIEKPNRKHVFDAVRVAYPDIIIVKDARVIAKDLDANFKDFKALEIDNINILNFALILKKFNYKSMEFYELTMRTTTE